VNLYAERDHVTLGEHYTRHVSAMTGEALHAKSAIAAELAHRDAEIERLAKINRDLVDKSNRLTIQSARDAAELDRLRTENEALSSSCAAAARHNFDMQAQLDRLRDECARLRADAERYRWIRQVAEGEAADTPICPAIKLYALQGAAEDAFLSKAPHLTDAIDAAMKGQP
jgi:chromosome segregation ATPase